MEIKPCPRCHSLLIEPRRYAKGWWATCGVCYYAVIPGDTEVDSLYKWNNVHREPTALERGFVDLIERAGAPSVEAKELVERFRFYYGESSGLDSSELPF